LSKDLKVKTIYRIVDANINRAKEGLRVAEEITRFVLSDKRLTTYIKNFRHCFQGVVDSLVNRKEELLFSRQSNKDVGQYIYAQELKRKDTKDIFFANIQRVKESLRVLEEFSKLINKKKTLEFKALRYSAYALEKKIVQRLKVIRNY